MAAPTTPPPPMAPGLFANLRFDAIAGFLVFLIAMPLCLAIAKASGFPPIAGIWTAVAGGLIATWVSNSQLTIKGPAAGLIVIVAGAVTGLGNEFVPEPPEEVRSAVLAERSAALRLDPDWANKTDAERVDEAGARIKKELEDKRAEVGYRLALGIGVVAGILQVLMGLLRAGRLVDFFPLTPVHGMLASIGIIIIAKQLYDVAGLEKVPTPAGGEPPGPLQVLAEFPARVIHFNPEILVIGGISLVIMFAHYFIKNRWVKMVPAQLIVLVVAMVLGSPMVFDLDHQHKHILPAHLLDGEPDNGEVVDWPKFLVSMPNVLAEPQKAFAFPDFRAIATTSGLRWLFLFVMIGSLESLLSAKAIDLIDPWKRKTSFDRDIIAAGLANAAVAMVGGLPMISEIVRSKANIDNGARTKMANAWHGLFLLVAVISIPGLLHEIPNAALAAMLVFTGFRLANPGEFVKTYKIGVEQLVVFLGTIAVTLATDLLIGILAGIGLKLAFHLWNGAPLRGVVWADVTTVTDGGAHATIIVRKAALFTNWLGLRKVILTQADLRDEITLDLSQTKLVDHSVMEKLHELQAELSLQGKKLLLTGLEGHKPLSTHPLAARKSAVSQPDSKPLSVR